MKYFYLVVVQLILISCGGKLDVQNYRVLKHLRI
jgi:hypothetical protein